MSVTIEDYINEEGKLSYENLWKELSQMTGFRAEVRRGIRFEEVRNAFNTYKAQQDNRTVDKALDSKDGVLSKGTLSEANIIKYINSKAGTEFTLAEDKYSTYDAEEPRYIAEIKIRNKHYADCLIEFDKYMANKGVADIEGKHFLYIVAVNPHIYVFNIHKLGKIKWEDREMPRNSHFGGYEDKKIKKVGYINVKKASMCYDYTKA
tara:strand:+ start:936 stop:1556 length:621 start_codon:yes stop_codon:yes gene_type:complete